MNYRWIAVGILVLAGLAACLPVDERQESLGNGENLKKSYIQSNSPGIAEDPLESPWFIKNTESAKKARITPVHQQALIKTESDKEILEEFELVEDETGKIQITPKPEPDRNKSRREPVFKKQLQPEKKSRPVEKCIILRQIQFNEDEIFTPAEQKKLSQKYLKQCVNQQMIKRVLSDVSAYYMAQDYITTKAYLTPQNISSGILKITVIKGVIEKIRFEDPHASDWQIKTAFAFIEGEPLNIRDLENALENVNRLPSNNASFQLLPGKEQGGTVVLIKNQKSFPARINLGISGDGTEENTDVTARIELDNLLDLNDILTLSYNGSKIQKEYQATRGYELNYTFPVGSFLYELLYSKSEYRQEVSGMNGRYLSEGETISKKLKVNKVLARSQKHKFDAKASITEKSTENYFEGSLIDVSSYKTAAAQADFVHTWLNRGGQLTSSFSYFQGLDWFGARKDSENVEEDHEETAKFQFQKYTLDFNLMHYLTQDSSPLSINSNLHVQHSEDVLHSSNQLVVGSDYTVRGYKDRSLSGSSGWYLKSDLKKTLNAGYSQALLQNTSFYFGYDIGEIKCEAAYKDTCGTIQGTALGLTTSGKHFSSEFVWSKALAEIGEDFDDSILFRYSLNFSF